MPDDLVKRLTTLRDHIENLDSGSQDAATLTDAIEALRTPTKGDAVEDLADALWQLLDDMGPDGQTVCIAAKDEAKAAYLRHAPYEDHDALPRALAKPKEDRDA